MKKFFLLTVLASICLYSAAQSGSADFTPVKITGGPFIQNVTTTGFTVVYTTNVDAVGWVEIAPDDGTHFYNCERPQYYDLSGKGRQPVVKLHKITVSGLEPGTTYRYRPMAKGVIAMKGRDYIIYDSGFGEDILKRKPWQVTTLKESYDSVRFAVLNDIHEGDDVLRELMKDASGKYDFVCFNGDMTSQVDKEQDIWDNYLESSSKLFAAQTPLLLARGNHEYRGNDAIRYTDYFETPTGMTYYACSFGKFFFIVLDSGEDKHEGDIRNLGIMVTTQYVEREAEWLRSVVNSDEFRNAKVRIAFCHQPPAPKGWYGGARVSNLLAPVLNEAGIDLMLCGHIHKYAFYKPGSRENDFPVVCNPNRIRLDVCVNGSGIRLDFVKPDGTVSRTQTFPVN